MPNALEEQLKAVHTSIAEVKRQLEKAEDPAPLEELLDELETRRLTLLDQLGVEF